MRVRVRARVRVRGRGWVGVGAGVRVVDAGVRVKVRVLLGVEVRVRVCIGVRVRVCMYVGSLDARHKEERRGGSGGVGGRISQLGDRVVVRDEIREGCLARARWRGRLAWFRLG